MREYIYYWRLVFIWKRGTWFTSLSQKGARFSPSGLQLRCKNISTGPLTRCKWEMRVTKQRYHKMGAWLGSSCQNPGSQAEDQSVQSHCLVFARLWTMLDNFLTVQVHPVFGLVVLRRACWPLPRHDENKKAKST